ncbi:MAG: T9SS type A sorting domain-containing protein [Candidatus Delongbacteria bacterium]|jgi:hypothetical protein|nr:T9SS type A sorting domain-containing protein [Candidatus Delongbacteria bacterium]
MKRKVCIFVIIIMNTYSLFSQDLFKVNRDSTIQNYKMENISSMSFSELNNKILRIKQKDGTYFDFDIDKVSNISFTDSSGIEDHEEIFSNMGISLLRNYPNPFNPVTTISFTLKEPGLTQIDIFNHLGQYVETIQEEKLNSGNHSIKWNAGGNRVSSGVYFVKVSQNDHVLSSKVLLIK